MISRNIEANEFLKVCDEFKLGELPTETPHPKTIGLSELAQNDLKSAISVLQNIDREVFRAVREKIPQILELKKTIKKVISNDGKIFLVGCGATGRLSLALETLWRIQYKDEPNKLNSVISFMAGGDVALIHSVEKFEDYPEFGVRQMLEVGLGKKDLLIATTEGGETPFVIGATNKAAEICLESPYFLYCNPDDVLVKTTKRSREVIENTKIKKVNLTVGPMALTGSTRMQATTILMYVVGLALLNLDRSDDFITEEIDRIISFVDVTHFDFIEPFILSESKIYKENKFLYYETDGELGISILTDTTERSPTFSLYSFENQLDKDKIPSLSYLLFPQSSNSISAWSDLLKRSPRAFYWPEVTDRTTIDRLYGFDFSNELLIKRKKYCEASHHRFEIYYEKQLNQISLKLDELEKKIFLNDLSFLSVHLILKILLNTHSTLVMGRMNRYESNLMTWVRSSNFKLIDRTIRYVQYLLKEKNINANYIDLVHLCFEFKDTIARDQSLVIVMVEEYLKRNS